MIGSGTTVTAALPRTAPTAACTVLVPATAGARYSPRLLIVPTPLTAAREPDLSYIINTGKTLSKHLRAGQLVVLESTTYPTTTRTIVLPRLLKSGLQPGIDLDDSAALLDLMEHG